MGRPKPLLRWHGLPLVHYQIDSLVKAGVAEVVVVLGHEHERIARHPGRPEVRYALNPDYRQGKATSIKAGLRRIAADAGAILLLAVDQPRPPDIIATLIRSHLSSDALITSPRHRGRGGHPVIFSSALRSELEAVSEEHQGIKEVFRAHGAEVNQVEIDDPIIRLDLNSPEQYDEARARFGA